MSSVFNTSVVVLTSYYIVFCGLQRTKTDIVMLLMCNILLLYERGGLRGGGKRPYENLVLRGSLSNIIFLLEREKRLQQLTIYGY